MNRAKNREEKGIMKWITVEEEKIKTEIMKGGQFRERTAIEKTMKNVLR